MAADRMQQQRFELKYLINEEMALKVRDFVRCYMDFDEYSVGKPNYSYAVHSVYLDSDDLKMYWDTINGVKNRFKLRMRYYDELPYKEIAEILQLTEGALKASFHHAVKKIEEQLRTSQLI
jgi:DNA-directed RNA polymerase specialized sigma subunit